MPRYRIVGEHNLDDAATKRRLMAAVGGLRGLYRVRLEPADPCRTNAANRYYWGVVVEAFASYLLDQGDAIHATRAAEMAHEILKQKFLPKTFVDRTTGEALTVGGSSAELSVDEFSRYLDACSVWLGEMGIVLPGMEIGR